MITITDVQAKLAEAKQELVEMSKQAGDSVKSFAEPDGQIHQQIQTDLDAMSNEIDGAFANAIATVKGKVNGWFKS